MVVEGAAASASGPSHDASQNNEAAASAAASEQPHQPTQNDQQASTSSAPSGSSGPTAWSGPSSSSVSHATGLETIDDVCNAIYNIAVSGGDTASQHKLAAQSLLPALQLLERGGTSTGTTGRGVLRSALQNEQDPLQALLNHVPPAGLGLGYLFIIVARCCAENANASYLLPYILQYIQMADVHQMRLVPVKVGLLASSYAKFMASQPGNALQALSDLHSKLVGDHRHLLAPTHQPLLYIALQAGEHPGTVQQLLEQPVTDVDSRIFPVTYQDNLGYHLYGGIHLATTRNYERAIQFLETAASAPAHPASTSLMQISAYQNLLLCQLLLHGKTSTLPKFAPSQLQSTFRQLFGTPYLDFVKAYESLDHAKIVELAVLHRRQFEKDQVLGLITRCVEAVPARKIVRLANVYKTIAVDDVVHAIGILRTDPAPAEEVTAGVIAFVHMEAAQNFVRQTVQDLVNQQKLSAVINATEGVGSGNFLDFVLRRPSPVEADRALQQSLQLLRHTSWTVSHLNQDISTSRDFLGKANAAAARSGFVEAGSNDFMSTITTGAEEDLMMGNHDKSEFWED